MRPRGWLVVLPLVIAACAIAGAAAVAPQIPDSSPDLVREPVIDYFRKPTTDAVARLNRRIQAGEGRLPFEERFGYLRSLLEALAIPPESQALVFSKNSLQTRHINPRNPRAVFFNDAVTLGFIPGAELIELAVQDAEQGVIFYTLDQQRADTPLIERRDFCLSCHNSASTLTVPGVLARSIVTLPTGATAPRFGNYVSDHRSPFDERWAGWYVTGTHGAMKHLGNTVLTNREDPDSMVSAETLNVGTLKGRIDTEAYLSPYSDIVALLVFEHQMRAMNLLTRLGWEARLAAVQRRAVPALSATAMPRPAQNARPVEGPAVDAAARELVDYLLFVDEAPLKTTVLGSSGFAERFAAAGPRDRLGRSLRQFDLSQRIMRFPCSYMIYSDAFEALPAPARDAVYRRMWRILSGEEQEGRYDRLSAADRRAVLEILRDTKPNLPDYFRPSPR
jgi:hypothetical protein